MIYNLYLVNTKFLQMWQTGEQARNGKRDEVGYHSVSKKFCDRELRINIRKKERKNALNQEKSQEKRKVGPFFGWKRIFLFSFIDSRLRSNQTFLAQNFYIRMSQKSYTVEIIAILLSLFNYVYHLYLS